VFRRLAAKADVIVENFRPDVKARLGIDYAALAKLNPRLVYASISGFGQDGPYANARASTRSPRAWAASCPSRASRAAGRCAVGIPIADLSPASSARFGILVALLEREQSGKGQEVATSLLQAQIFMLDFQGSRWLNAREVPARPATIIQPASRPACSRRATATSISPPPERRRGSGCAAPSAPRA
jgi:formyl-CoA transferase